MADEQLDEMLGTLSSDIEIEAAVSGDLKAACFFRIYHELGTDNGDFPDLTYAPVQRDGRGGYQIDGYAVSADREELFLVVSDYRQKGDVETLDAADLNRCFRRAERFFDLSLREEFISQLEETSPAFDAAWAIYSSRGLLSRIRFVLLSNARLSTRRKSVDTREVNGRAFTYNVLDLRRYTDILSSSGGSEPLEIDILEFNGGKPIPCLRAYSGGDGYESYLVVLPGLLLCEIYGRFGPRLLEQNVRSFLQARTKVNRGIISTISDEPEMFFAYNNGLTVTAAGIETCTMKNGETGIRLIRNMQIVNGGQTTASILYANDRRKSDLSGVFVQMKLSVVDSDKVEEIVPRISRFANTQNRISEADFFSGHPFHVEMEKISRRLSAPPKAGALNSSKWFYERARGQYADRRARGGRRFETEFPKDQVITKTDLGKYQMTFDCKPHIVSQGAQKCFLAFADIVGTDWEKRQVSYTNDAYFRDVVSKAIVFRWCDRMIARSDWYRSDRGYKSQTVTYTVAWLANWAWRSRKVLDLQRIWNDQDAPAGIRDALTLIAPAIAGELRNAPPELRNLGEYAKQQICWERVSGLDIRMPEEINSCLISEDEEKSLKKSARKDGVIYQDVQMAKLSMACVAVAGDIRSHSREYGFLTPKSDRVLSKIENSRLPLSAADLKIFGKLCKLLQENGFQLPDPDA